MVEKTKEEQDTHSSPACGDREENVIIRRRTTEEATPYVPIIRVIGEVNVRELLGRDTEDDESVTHTPS
jgi:hypothetical protein